MARPGTQVLSREAPPSRAAPTDTGQWLVAGLTERGDTSGPVTLHGMSDYARQLGPRVSYGLLHDSLETFFREGGAVAHVARVVGPAAAVATRTLMDGATTPVASLRIDAVSPGDWANSLRVEVLAGTATSTFVLVISHVTDGELERSPDLVDRAAAVAWATQSRWVRATQLASTLNPAVAAAAALASGTDDRANITDTQWALALGRLGVDLGPGQVSMPGRTTTVAHQALLEHAATRNRVAVLDGLDTATDATLRTLTAAARSASGDVRYGALFAPWVVIPGALAGTSRTVPYSALQAGLTARADASGGPNVPAAGDNGRARFALGVTQTWDDATREALNAAGVNVAREIGGIVTTYGYRTLVDPVAAPGWLQFSNARLNMAIVAQAGVIAERYVFSQLDGRGRRVAQFAGELDGMLLGHYEAGALFGDAPGDAFRVETGGQVNTPQTLAAGELRAVLSLRMSPFAELVTIEIVKVAITEEITS